MLVGCSSGGSSSNGGGGFQSSGCSILNFSINGQVGETTINQTSHLIQLYMPTSNNLADLAPLATLSQGATINQPAAGTGFAYNMSSPMAFTVASQNGQSSQSYIVTVSHPSFYFNGTQNDVNLFVGQNYSLVPVTTPSNLTVDYAYSTSSFNVSPNGYGVLITPYALGSGMITATLAQDSSTIQQVMVNVVTPVINSVGYSTSFIPSSYTSIAENSIVILPANHYVNFNLDSNISNYSISQCNIEIANTSALFANGAGYNTGSTGTSSIVTVQILGTNSQVLASYSFTVDIQ